MTTQLSYFIYLGLIVLFPLAFCVIHHNSWKKTHIDTILTTVLLVSIPYILFDWIAVKIGLWTYNTQRVVGIYVGNLPIEEILFFLAIPFSTLFIWATIFSRRTHKELITFLLHHFRQ